MQYMPFFFDLKRRRCLVVGGGRVATRKARLLTKAGALLTVVAPYITDEMVAMTEAGGGVCHYRAYLTSDLNDCALVICATDDNAVNVRVSKEAQAANIPVNVVDSPALCSIITPAIVDRSPLIVAIGSGGEAPVLARHLRSKLEALLPSAYGRLASIASNFREQVKVIIKNADARLRFWEKVFDGPVAERVFNGDIDGANIAIKSLLDNSTAAIDGEVYLVGGGPGDPDLLTFKALRLMQQADVVLYDRLVSDGVLDKVRRDADRIYVGKRRNDHAVPQQAINQLLVDLAKSGKRVLRLKGGDPFIFGRGGEEIELLAEQGIPFQVVPGITAASGCAAYSGIPLTHRDYSQSVRFIAGHTKKDHLDLPWAGLMETDQTLVFYMALTNLEEICHQLVVRGRDPYTPAALIERGTTVNQTVFVGDLMTLPDIVKQKSIHAPTLLIIGDVVKLHQKLQWFRT